MHLRKIKYQKMNIIKRWKRFGEEKARQLKLLKLSMKCSYTKKPNKKFIHPNHTDRLFKKSFKKTMIKLINNHKLIIKYLERK